MSLLHSQILGTGKPLLVLHGFLGMSDNWRTMGKQWAAHFEVHLIDLRNHGRSFHSDAFSYADMAADLTHIVIIINCSKSSFWGIPWGVNSRCIMQRPIPNKSKNWLLLILPPRPTRHITITFWKGWWTYTPSLPKSRGDADQRLSRFVTDQGTRLFLLKNLYRTPEGFALRINAPVLQGQVGQVMMASDANYHGPTLFLAGEKSDYILPARPRTNRFTIPPSHSQNHSQSGALAPCRKPRCLCCGGGVIFWGSINSC